MLIWDLLSDTVSADSRMGYNNNPWRFFVIAKKMKLRCTWLARLERGRSIEPLSSAVRVLAAV